MTAYCGRCRRVQPHQELSRANYDREHALARPVRIRAECSVCGAKDSFVGNGRKP